MPTTEAALFSLLTAGSPNPVAAIIGTRAYPDVLPQAVTYPAIRFQRISTPRSQYRTLDGHANYASPRFQIDCWATQKSQALELADAVYRLLEGFTGYAGGQPGSPEDTGLRIDFISTEDQAGDVEPGIGPGAIQIYRERLDVFVAHPE